MSYCDLGCDPEFGGKPTEECFKHCIKTKLARKQEKIARVSAIIMQKCSKTYGEIAEKLYDEGLIK